MFKNSLTLNNKGMGLVATTALVAAGLSILIMTGIYQITDSYSRKLVFLEEWQSKFVQEKAASVGTYLITNHLVWCRETNWLSGRKCKWGGGANADLSLYSYLKDISSPNQPLTYRTNIVTDNFTVEDVEISFDLVDLKQEKSIQDAVNFRSVNTDDIFDNDHHIVLMTINVPYKDKRTEENKVTVSKRVIRRPFAFVKVISSTPASQCASSCYGSNTNNVDSKTAECRSMPLVGTESKSNFKVKVVNEGPGVLYKLKLLKKVSFLDTRDKKYDEKSVVEGIPAQISDPEAVLLPNDPVEITLSAPCRLPGLVQTFSSSESSSNARGRRGQPGWTETNTEVTVETNLHEQDFAKTSVSVYRQDDKKVNQIEPARLVKENLNTSQNSAQNIEKINTHIFTEVIIYVPPH